MNLRARFPHLAGDLRGAFFSILVGLPYSITAGMLAFAPFGPAYVANGVVAGIASAAMAGIVNALVGGTPLQINGPRGSVAVLMAGLITAITVHPAFAAGDAPDVPKILGITMLCMGLSGLLQVAFGLLRFGAVIRFLPYPVSKTPPCTASSCSISPGRPSGACVPGHWNYARHMADPSFLGICRREIRVGPAQRIDLPPPNFVLLRPRC